jgi:arylsulfatase
LDLSPKHGPDISNHWKIGWKQSYIFVTGCAKEKRQKDTLAENMGFRKGMKRKINIAIRKAGLICALILAAAAIANAGAGSKRAGSRPNIIIVMPDDISWGSMSLFGGTRTDTPHLDALFKEGTRLMNFHVSPTCSPSRASTLTGRHEFYSGITHTVRNRAHMNPQLKILPQMLKECGYTTCMVGKWHLGDVKELRPSSRGFDEVFQHGGGGIGQSGDFPGNTYNDPTILHNETIIETKGYCTDVFFDHAIRWMQTQTKPFFVYLTPNVIHAPYQPPKEYLDIADTKEKAISVTMKNLDDNMGKLVSFLESSGLDKNTIVIYYTDNGGSDSRVLGLNAGKGSASEGGLRVPCVFYWKGHLEKGTEITDVTGHVDLWPTLADLAGYEGPLAGTQPWDGRSLLPILEGRHIQENHCFVGHRARWEDGDADASQYVEASIQDNRHKLYFRGKNGKEDGHFLYDVSNDKGEKIDIKDSHPEITARLKTAYDRFWNDVRPHMINEAPEEKREGKSVFHEMYRKEMGEEKYKDALARKDELFKFYFRSEK